MEEDKKFVENILKLLVEYPSDVKVVRSVDEMGVLLTVSVNPYDMGKVIGKEGNTIKALRTLARTVGMKNQAKVNIKLLDPRKDEVDDAFNQAKEY